MKNDTYEEARKGPPGFSFSFMGVIVVTSITTIFIQPFRFLETLLILSLGIALFIVAAGFVWLQDKPEWPYKPLATDDVHERAKRMTPAFARSIPVLRTIITIGVSVMLADGVFILDKFLDRSPGEMQDFTITSKYTSHNKSGSRTYYHVRFMPGVPSLVAAIDFDGEESEQVTLSEYDQVVFGVTQIRVVVHPGFFRLPWYEEKYVLVNTR